MPGVLLAAFAATYLVLLLSGSALVDAQAQGWMFRPQPLAGLISPWHADALRNFSWTAMPALAGDVLAVMFVTIITLLLNTTGIEIATRTEANIERDLKVLGACQYRGRRARRLCELHFAEPLDPGPHRRCDRAGCPD